MTATLAQVFEDVEGAGVAAQKTIATVLRRFHLTATCMWALLVAPTLLWWRDSILWIALMSVWANLASHFSAWQATRTEQREMER